MNEMQVRVIEELSKARIEKKIANGEKLYSFKNGKDDTEGMDNQGGGKEQYKIFCFPDTIDKKSGLGVISCVLRFAGDVIMAYSMPNYSSSDRTKNEKGINMNLAEFLRFVGGFLVYIANSGSLRSNSLEPFDFFDFKGKIEKFSRMLR